MDFPTPGEYQEALQHPEAAFADPELQEATPKETVLGLPQAITGAFAAVFPMQGPTGPWAVKCFLNEAPARRERYQTLAAYLEEADLPYTLSLDYQPDGIRVAGEAYPLLKMEWAQGTTLNRFVAQHREEPEQMAALAARFAEMTAALEAAQIAHGDLQHGNVLIQKDDEELALRLVDYDTMYVPPLEGHRSAEVGHRNYQHPDRDEHDFGPSLDRFSALVIYTGLQAIRHRPELWERFDTGENVLFRADDFFDPDASPLFEALAQIEPVRPLAETLRTACYLEPEAVPPLAHIREGATLPEAPVRRRRSASAPDRRTARRGIARYFLPGAVAVLVVVGGLVLAGWALAAAGIFAGALGAGAWISWRTYQRVPAVRRRHRLEQERAYFDRVIRDLRRQVETRKAQRQGVLNNVDQLRAERLEEVQEEALYDRLKYHFVNEAKAVEGIGHKAVVRLKAAGIRTAYQATPERLQEVRRLGDRRRARVRMWRASLVQEYEEEIPDTLSPAEERRLERYVERRAQGFAEEIERLRAKIQVQEEEREAVEDRLARVPHVSFLRYVGYLLRLRELPPRVRQPADPSNGAAQPASPSSAHQPTTMVPEEAGERGPWWKRS